MIGPASVNSPLSYKIPLWLAIITLIYNLAEGIVATFFGYEDESLALFGFGIDSFIESVSAIGLILMISRIWKHPDRMRADSENLALRITGTSFYLLVVGLIASAVVVILTDHKPQTTVSGVILSVVSIFIMAWLIHAKAKAGRQLNSAAILADAQCSKVCLYMSLILLASAGFYYLTGFKYADVLGAIGLASFAYREAGECFDKISNETHCGCEP
jgi:divalent metal cation (Fe/Co/Zn/Cd) transporter